MLNIMNYNKQRLILCKGNQGKQLFQDNLLQIRLYQLQKITREQILKQYSRTSNRKQQPINLITTKRNYYIDMLLSKNLQLIVHDNQQTQFITSKQIQLPLQLQIIYPDQDFKIQSQVQVNIKYFNILQKIGEGTFAQIYIAEQKYDKKIVTIKRINKTEQLQKGNKQMLLNQFTTLKYRYNHKIHLLYMFQSEQFIYFVTDYCVFGNLYTLIQKQKQIHQCQQCGHLNKAQKYSIWLQVAFMIVHMHSKGWIYRDLKPENILIDQRGLVKLCDFGYAVKYQKNQTFKELCGTMEYIPPQLVYDVSYDKTIDLYGLGILLYELIASHTPFEGITLENMHQKKNEKISFDKKIFSSAQRDLIELLTKSESQDRLGYANSMTIFKHSFFESKEIIGLIQQIIKKTPNYHLLLKLDYSKPKQLKVRQQQLAQHSKFFEKPYNYLTPSFEIDQKIGPKFNSSY